MNFKIDWNAPNWTGFYNEADELKQKLAAVVKDCDLYIAREALGSLYAEVQGHIDRAARTPLSPRPQESP